VGIVGHVVSVALKELEVEEVAVEGLGVAVVGLGRGVPRRAPRHFHLPHLPTQLLAGHQARVPWHSQLLVQAVLKFEALPVEN